MPKVHTYDNSKEICATVAVGKHGNYMLIDSDCVNFNDRCKDGSDDLESIFCNQDERPGVYEVNVTYLWDNDDGTGITDFEYENINITRMTIA